MADLPTTAELTELAGLLTPGIVILWVRSRFRNAMVQPIGSQLLGYAVASITYNGMVYPLFHASDGVRLPDYLWQLLFAIGTPWLVAMALVFFDRSEWFYTASEWLGLRPAHHIQTAWDFTFPSRPPSYVLVHLVDGSTVAGAWTRGSFASSIPEERDLLISQLWRLDGDDWIRVEPPRAALISGASIRMVEFISGG